jgi:ribose transport system permease protein
MLLLYLVGLYVNPVFFGKPDALAAVLRDAARYGVMAVGMTFVIINKDLDLSVGSTYGLVATVFSIAFAQSHFDAGIGVAVLAGIITGIIVGLINGVLVTTLRVPAFIATLTMLFIGRGLVLGLTGGKTISFLEKRNTRPASSPSGRPTPWASTARSSSWPSSPCSAPMCSPSPAGLRDLRHRRQRIGRDLCRHPDPLGPHPRLSPFLAVRHARRADGRRTGQGHHLAGRLRRRAHRHRGGDRRRRLHPRRPRPHDRSVLGAIMVVLIDKVLREGVPTTRIIKVGGVDMECRPCRSCRPARSRPSSA